MSLGSRRRTGLRALACVHVAFGSVLLARPREGAGVVGIRGADVPPTWVCRVLGVRTLAQGAALLAAPDEAIATGGAVVDTLHAATMVPLALRGRYRHAAAVSGGFAAASAAVAAGLLAGRGR